MKQTTKDYLKFVLCVLPLALIAGVFAGFSVEKILPRHTLQVWGAQVGGIMPLLVIIALAVAVLLVACAVIVKMAAVKKSR